jgi:predicted dehydrogenase
MADKRLRWGVIGTANIGRAAVIPALQRSGNGELVAVASRDDEKASAFAAQEGIPRSYGSYEALLAAEDIEAVYIPLPNSLHREWTIKAAEAGKHILCEKPLALNAAECDEMASAAEQHDVVLMEAFMYRFHPRSQRIKQLVAEGRIGAPCLVRSTFCFRMGEMDRASEKNVRLKPEMGGGALLDVGCYSVSVARWFLGSEPTQVQAQAVYHPGGVDMHIVGTLGFADTALATFEASFISALQQTYSIAGADGVIELPHNAFVPWENDAAFFIRGQDEEVGQQHVIPGADEYQLMVAHFADVVRGNTDLMVPLSDSIGNMRVLDALAQAARTGETIKI